LNGGENARDLTHARIGANERQRGNAAETKKSLRLLHLHIDVEIAELDL
jgi:hypothetical protein